MNYFSITTGCTYDNKPQILKGCYHRESEDFAPMVHCYSVTVGDKVRGIYRTFDILVCEGFESPHEMADYIERRYKTGEGIEITRDEYINQLGF